MPDLREDLEDSAVTRHAAEWGLASLLMGGILSILALITLLLNLTFWLGSRHGPVLAPADMHLAYKGVIAALALIALLCLLSLIFGIKAWRSARTNYQPAGLGVAGTLISVLALLLWVIVGADLIMIFETFTRPPPLGVPPPF
jgi:uncharacterized membrane protein